jgi:hypothetical protein
MALFIGIPQVPAQSLALELLGRDADRVSRVEARCGTGPWGTT